MPRGARTDGAAKVGDRVELPSGTIPREQVVHLDASIQAELRPYLDLTEVGEVGFLDWLRSVLPLIPRPGPTKIPPSSASAEARLREVARALATCAGERARTHFQAAEYFRENQLLARRVKALEAILRTSASAVGSPRTVPTDPAASRAADRYLPRSGAP